MGRSGRRNPKRQHGLQHRRQKCQMEWARANELYELLDRCRVAAVVSGRTGGRCYWPGCQEPIVSYPHAIPRIDGGVHHPVNRAGLCTTHAAALHQGGPAGEQYRLCLQEWLMDWYAERGLAPDYWTALASGREPIRDLTRDVVSEGGGENAAAVG